MLVIFIMNCITRTKINTAKKVNGLDTKNRQKLDYKKLRLSDDYQYPSEEEQEKKTRRKTRRKNNIWCE